MQWLTLDKNLGPFCWEKTLHYKQYNLTSQLLLNTHNDSNYLILVVPQTSSFNIDIYLTV